MAKFEKGHQKVGGRLKGTPNAKRLLKVEEVLIEKGYCPVAVILELIPHLEPEDQVKSWFNLLSYCQAKPKEETGETDTSITPLPEEAVAALVTIARRK